MSNCPINDLSSFEALSKIPEINKIAYWTVMVSQNKVEEMTEISYGLLFITGMVKN